eukprot:480323_1
MSTEGHSLLTISAQESEIDQHPFLNNPTQVDDHTCNSIFNTLIKYRSYIVLYTIIFGLCVSLGLLLSDLLQITETVPLNSSFSQNNINKNERIPFIIWQTAPNHNIENNSILMQQINEYKKLGFDYRLIDYYEMKSLFTDPTITNINEYKIFGGNITKAFLMINSINGTALSDYWRYYVLWKYGGIYIDLDTKCHFSKTKI